MGVLVNDTEAKTTCLCGHSQLTHHTGSKSHCRFVGCDCAQFTLSFEELIERLPSENELPEVMTDNAVYNRSLFVTAQAAIVNEIRWLQENGFSDFTVERFDNFIMLRVKMMYAERASLLDDRNFFEYIASNDDFNFAKEFNITERRKQDRRRNAGQVLEQVYLNGYRNALPLLCRDRMKNIAFAMANYLKNEGLFGSVMPPTKEKLFEALENAVSAKQFFETAPDPLAEFAQSGVLPQIITETGADGEPILEVIVCDSISGGARYDGSMPQELGLIRKLASGVEWRARYVKVTPV